MGNSSQSWEIPYNLLENNALAVLGATDDRDSLVLALELKQ